MRVLFSHIYFISLAEIFSKNILSKKDKLQNIKEKQQEKYFFNLFFYLSECLFEKMIK